LGRGGMGIVYRAVQTSLNRPVALKMTLAHIPATDEYLERFKKEAESYAELNDRHFVQIYEFGESKGRPYMALEFVQGGSLEQYRQGEPQLVEFSAKLVETLARTMHKAHAAGLVHRDLKPHNVLLTPEGMPKITDFGLVKRQNQESEMTEQGRVMGTASYMAPEQSRGQEVGPPADTHALGAILYCLLTGRPPFLAATVYDTIIQVRNEAPVAPSRLRPGVPADLETICLKSLEKEPAKRYSSAAELAGDLRRYLEGRPIVARPVSPAERSWRWAKRNPWLAGLGTSVAVLLVTIAVVSSVMSWRLTVQKTAALHNAEVAKIAKGEAEVAEGIATDQGFISLELVRNVLTNIGDALRNSAAQLELKKRIIELTKPSLDKIVEQMEANPLVGRTQAMVWQRLGDVYREAGLVQEAAGHFDRTHGMLQKLALENPEDPVHQQNLAVIVNKLAEVHKRLGNTIQSRDFYQQGLDYYTRWAEMRPGDDLPQQRVAEAHVWLGKINFTLGDPAAALQSYENSRVEWRKVPDLFKLSEVYRQLADLEQKLGQTHYQLGNQAEAERFLGRALQKRQDMVQSKRTDNRVDDLCRSRLALGDFYLAGQKDANKAWAQYKPAAAEFQQLWETDQEDARKRTALAAAHYRLGAAVDRTAQLGAKLNDVDAEDAQQYFKKSCELREALAQIDPADMQAKIEWALALARCGRSVEAETVADELVEKGEGNPRLLSQAAATYALCLSAADDTLMARYREKAIKTLKQCIEAGWKDEVALQDDPDLDPIRNEPEFIQLQKDLQASAAKAADTPSAS